jgi:anti-sigma factor RsiW
MGNKPDQLRLSPDERADLVAYLDGELTEAHSRSLATKLTHSATARREVETLKRTWELLEHLPFPHVSEQFPEKTVTHIRRLELESHAWEPRVAVWSSRVARVLICLGTASAALGLGYAVTRWVWPDPTVRLVRDLTLAEHLDEYLEVGSFDFLSQLADSREFGGDAH